MDFTEETGAGGFPSQGGKKGKKGKKNQQKNEDIDEEEAARIHSEKQAAMKKAMTEGGSDSDSDDDPVFGKKKKQSKGKKNPNPGRERGAGKGKKGKKAKDVSEDEEEEVKEEENKDEVSKDEEVKEEAAVVTKVTYPLEMVYCKCGLPPEYCEFGGKGAVLDACKAWLKETHPELYANLYEDAEEEKLDANQLKQKQKQKSKKKVGFVADSEKKVRVIKLKRGGKKAISSIVGLDDFGCNLADVAKLLSRKMGSGAAAILIEHKEISREGIQVQGDVTERFEDFIKNDLKQFNINIDAVTYEEGGNKKNRTK